MKSNGLYNLKILISILNFVMLSFLSATILYTVHRINENFVARSFLDNITYLPMEPVKTTAVSFILFFLLLYIIEVRKKMEQRSAVNVIIYGIEIFVCLTILKCTYAMYNGILLLAVADIVTSIKGKYDRYLFFGIMAFIYIFADYDIISLHVHMISFEEFLSVYSGKVRMLLTGIRNILASLNTIAFTAYMILLVQNQKKENARIALLNIQMETANKKLQDLNEKLADYALMQEKMGETKERNRIAREIHDTLGHTMTGLSAGIDACIAMIDFSADATKKQLYKISEVARQGIKDIRRSVSKLRPDALEHLNLEKALEKLIQDTMDISDVVIKYECEIPVLKFNSDEEDMIYRVVQEGITNAIRHGKASEIHIHISQKYQLLILKIKDNGIGCENIKSGFGLMHIEERMKMLGGDVIYHGNDGFEIIARIPIRWGEKYD